MTLFPYLKKKLPYNNKKNVIDQSCKYICTYMHHYFYHIKLLASHYVIKKLL